VRITTWNVNGLRAALRKGLHDHLEAIRPDVVMLQEIRATPAQLPVAERAPEGWFCSWHPAERKGYSGVATWTRDPQWVVGVGMDDLDPEGRILRTRTRKLQLVNVYLPSGSRSEEAQQRKERWMERFLPWSAALTRTDEPVLLAGDLNIAHTADDIHNPTGNKKNSGFLPHERQWFSELLASGWVDLFRTHRGPGKGPYSWWSNRGRARELDRGWRIDYVLGNAAAAERLRGASIRRQGGLEVSDHAPVTVNLRAR